MWRSLLVLLLFISPAAGTDEITCRLPPPDKRQAPTVLYDVFYETVEELFLSCTASNRLIKGCAIKIGRNYWQVYIKEGMHPKLHHCVLLHEYGHLPPNNWIHPGRYYKDDNGQWRPRIGPIYRRHVVHR